MQPKSLSATAIKVAHLCLSRYHAENILRGNNIPNSAALLGTSTHGALEMFVQFCYLQKTQEPSLGLLQDLFDLSFMQVTGSVERESEDYQDGRQMCEDWFARTDFNTFEVISAEVKENFPVKTSIGPIPFNYIWDRHDRLPNGEVRVVDYKTNRWGYRPEDLIKLPQARCYGLAAQIKYPDAPRIWVEFDMLRHGGPVGVAFDREDNANTWRWLRREAQRIVDTPDDEAPETLNPECNFCVKKATCKALMSNVNAGGIFSLPIAEIVDRRAALEYQKKAVSVALAEIDEYIFSASKADDIFEFEGDSHHLEITIPRRRDIDPERVEMVIGPNLMTRYGGKTITLAKVKELLKGDELTEAQKKQLNALIFMKDGNPKINVKPHNPIDEE